MIENIFLSAAGLLFITFIWSLWHRNILARSLSAVREKESLLQKDYWIRRDTIPYLLESYKAEKEPNDIWPKLVEARARFQPDENEIDELLRKFLQESQNVKNINFREAVKDITGLNRHIDLEKTEIRQSVESYNILRKRFPYSLASAIFSFREIS